MKSYFTKEEFDHLIIEDLISGNKALLMYRHVSHGQLSIARFTGVVKIHGLLYTYFPEFDELIRDDALKAVTKMRKEADKAQSTQKELLL